MHAKTKELDKVVVENNLVNEKIEKLEKLGQLDVAKTPASKV